LEEVKGGAGKNKAFIAETGVANRTCRETIRQHDEGMWRAGSSARRQQSIIGAKLALPHHMLTSAAGGNRP
jgi:hypothetical protein